MSEHNPIDVEPHVDTNFSDDYKECLKELEETSKSLCIQLQERLITLTASTKSLKEKVCIEKELWKTELKETIDLEKKLPEYKWHNCCTSSDYNYQLEILTNAFLKRQATKAAEIQKDIETNTYRQKLIEADNMCQLEMLKIKSSLERLAPLQAIVNEWTFDKQELADDLKIKNSNSMLKDVSYETANNGANTNYLSIN